MGKLGGLKQIVRKHVYNTSGVHLSQHGATMSLRMSPEKHHVGNVACKQVVEEHVSKNGGVQFSYHMKYLNEI